MPHPSSPLLSSPRLAQSIPINLSHTYTLSLSLAHTHTHKTSSSSQTSLWRRGVLHRSHDVAYPLLLARRRYIGTEITMQFRMKASGINLDTTAAQAGYRPTIAPDEDPGMPNLANMSEPVRVLASPVSPPNRWTPRCPPPVCQPSPPTAAPPLFHAPLCLFDSVPLVVVIVFWTHLALPSDSSPILLTLHFLLALMFASPLKLAD
jgi:hypothetical protein